jgi:hypothetical protein
MLLPGLGQAVDGRTFWPYAAVGAAGIGGSVYIGARYSGEVDYIDLPGTSLPSQGFAVANAFYVTAGGLSAYETYRHRAVDRMGFDTERFRPAHELLLGPVHFESALHWPVAGSLLLAGTLAGLQLADVAEPFAGYLPRDAGTTVFVSVGAGIGEEALYRGWFMSYLEHRWGWNRWLANGTQSVLFGLSHGGLDFRILYGFIDGMIAQGNDYDLMDNVFAHTWWDILLITAKYAGARQPPEGAMIVLPPIPF